MVSPIISAAFHLLFWTSTLVSGLRDDVLVQVSREDLNIDIFSPRPDITTVTDVQAKCGTSVDSSTNKYFLYCVARDSSIANPAMTLRVSILRHDYTWYNSSVSLNGLNPLNTDIELVFEHCRESSNLLAVMLAKHGGVFLTIGPSEVNKTGDILLQKLKERQNDQYEIPHILMCTTGTDGEFLYCLTNNRTMMKVSANDRTFTEVEVPGSQNTVSMSVNPENNLLLQLDTEFVVMNIFETPVLEMYRFLIPTGYKIPNWVFNPLNKHQMFAFCTEGTTTIKEGFCVFLFEYAQANATNKLKVTHSLFDIPNISIQHPVIIETLGYVGFFSTNQLTLLSFDLNGWMNETRKSVYFKDGVSTINLHGKAYFLNSTREHGTQDYYFAIISTEAQYSVVKVSFEHCRLREEDFCPRKYCLEGYYPNTTSTAAGVNICLPERQTFVQEGNNLVLVRCSQENCLECPQNRDHCARCETNYYELNQECKLGPPSIPCIDILHCQACTADPKHCKECLAANPERYLQTIGDTIVCSIPREFPAGYGLDIANNKMASCSDDNCLDCYEDHKVCKICNEKKWLYHPNATCLSELLIPPGYGRNLSSQATNSHSLQPCDDSQCHICWEDYRNCTACKPYHTQYLMHGFSACRYHPECTVSLDPADCRKVYCDESRGEVNLNVYECTAVEFVKWEHSRSSGNFSLYLNKRIPRDSLTVFERDECPFIEFDVLLSDTAYKCLKYNKDFTFTVEYKNTSTVLVFRFLRNNGVKGTAPPLIQLVYNYLIGAVIAGSQRMLSSMESPRLESDVGRKIFYGEVPSFEDTILDFMGDYSVLAILTFVPFLCFCWRNMQVAIYSLQMLSSVHIWHMLCWPHQNNPLQTTLDYHKIYKMVLFVQSLSDNSSCSLSEEVFSRQFLWVRNVSCSVPMNLMLVVFTSVLLFSGVAFYFSCIKHCHQVARDGSDQPNISGDDNEDCNPSYENVTFSTLAGVWGMCKGIEPAALLYAAVTLESQVSNFWAYALILIFVIMFAVGLYCGIQLYTRFKTAKVDPADRTYQDAVGSTAKIFPCLFKLFGAFHWVDNTLLNKNILVYLEPTITSLRNILLVVFVFVFHKNSVAQHYWILGLEVIYKVYTVYVQTHITGKTRNLIWLFTLWEVAWTIAYFTGKFLFTGKTLLFTVLAMYFGTSLWSVIYLWSGRTPNTIKEYNTPTDGETGLELNVI